MPPAKPLVLRVLEQRRIPHEVLRFDPAIRSAEGVAAALGIAPHLVYKTLVIEHDPPKGKPYLVLIPAPNEVDLKLLAAAVGAKKLRMSTHRDAERYTGLQVGGISALALIGKGFPVFIDARALDESHILVSGGQRRVDVRLAVSDLIALTGARPVQAASSG
jgi:Cys-tRNA(Pro)/Cys-tRNA(Cys) deacylase